MYALDSAHVKVQRLKRRSFAVLFDKLSRIERQVDLNTNLSNLIDANVDVPNLIIRFGTYKVRRLNCDIYSDNNKKV